jgi:hypothetical protein
MTGDLRLPKGIEPLEIAGHGRRSVTWRASLEGETIALKVYRQAFVDKYQQRFKVNIAQFEHDRNLAFYGVEGLKIFSAKPLGLIGIDDGYSLCFLQEFIDGPTLVELAKSNHGLPQSVLDAGRLICEEAEAAGLHDLDIFFKNVMVRQISGQWLPVLHDFNLLPQYQFPPNPFLAIAYMTGVRKKSHRDWRCLKGWKAFSDECRRTEI